MRPSNFNERHAVFNLVTKYEAMVVAGSVYFANPKSYHTVIDYYERECLLERALEAVKHAIGQVGYDAYFFLRNSELLLSKKQPGKCLATLDQVDAMTPHILKSGLLRAEALTMMGLQGEAISLLDELKLNAPGKELSKIYVCEALVNDSLKEFERMFYLLKAALAEDPSNTEALSRMWYVVEYARKHEESVELHESIVDEDPYNALAWYNLGASQLYLGRYEEAIEAYENATLAKPDFEFAYRECAEACLLVRDFQKALSCYQDVMERFEPDADLFLNIGKCYEELGSFIVARDFFQRAVQLDPYNAEAQFHIGVCFGREKNWVSAIAALQKAVKFEERNEDYLSALAEAYANTGNQKKSLHYYREAADTAPELPEHWSRLACFLMKCGRFDEALEVFDEAEDYTWGPELLYGRFVCLFAMGSKQDALHVLEEALYEDYDSHEAIFRMMPALERDRDVKAVISIFQPE